MATRDSQKAKVFRVEDDLRALLKPSSKDLPFWASKLAASAWFQKRLPLPVIYVERASGLGQCACRLYGGLRLGSARYDQLGVVHALAHKMATHELVKLGQEEGFHGRTFARAYLELVKHVWGNTRAKELRELYQKHGVKRVAVSAETREKRREAWHDREAAKAQKLWSEWLQTKGESL